VPRATRTAPPRTMPRTTARTMDERIAVVARSRAGERRRQSSRRGSLAASVRCQGTPPISQSSPPSEPFPRIHNCRGLRLLLEHRQEGCGACEVAGVNRCLRRRAEGRVRVVPFRYDGRLPDQYRRLLGRLGERGHRGLPRFPHCLSRRRRRLRARFRVPSAPQRFQRLCEPLSRSPVPDKTQTRVPPETVGPFSAFGGSVTVDGPRVAVRSDP
jgi:hypothetical protein